jgi:hypothetical protein
VSGAGDDLRERSLPAAGRSPEDQRRDLVGLDRAPQQAPGAEHRLLADELIERARPEARGQRRVRGRGSRLRFGWEERRGALGGSRWHRSLLDLARLTGAL